jgi:hypothetical protein
LASKVWQFLASAEERSQSKLMSADITQDNGANEPYNNTPDADQHTDPASKPPSWLRLHWEKVKHVGLHEWLMVLATITMATSTVFYTKYARGQLDAIQGELDQMKGGSAQTDRLIEKADSIAGSMNEANAQQKKALDETLRQSRESLNRTLVQSNAALQASIDASRNDERAWVGIVDLRLTKEPTLSEDTVITYDTVNTGKTPALNVSAKSGFFFGDSEPPPPDWSQTSGVTQNRPVGVTSKPAS